jgi:DNA invertase Pin-like site-specific DNA recombinase
MRGEHKTRQRREENTIAAYVRVSSEAQTDAMQRDAITRCARARGQTVQQWYAERESATRTMHRPVLQSVRQLSRQGWITTLYVYRIDRLTRTGIADTLNVLEEFRLHGTKVISVADGFDVSGLGPAAEMVLAALAWAAKIEGMAINERIAAARKRIEAKGGKWGRPRRMTKKEVTRAKEMQAQGRSIRELAQVLRVPRATLQRWLKTPPPRGPVKTGTNGRGLPGAAR